MSSEQPSSLSLMSIIGWSLLVIGLVCFAGPFFLTDWLGHQVGAVGFAFIFVGISLLKKRKDQLK